jgi:hypothetical protein
LSRPRTLTFFVPPIVCSQPKHSSMRLRTRCEMA